MTTEALAAVLARATDASSGQIVPGTVFRKRGTWASFAALALIYGIEARFGG